jgi:hypothetical protein
MTLARLRARRGFLTLVPSPLFLNLSLDGPPLVIFPCENSALETKIFPVSR